MRFFDFCTDVTFVGVTAVLGLFLAGGVANEQSSDDAAPQTAAASAGVFASPTGVHLPAVDAPAAAAVINTPQPLDLRELERSLDSLLSPQTPAPPGAALDDLLGGIFDEAGDDAPAAAARSPLAIDAPLASVDPGQIPVDRPDTRFAAPPTRPLTDRPLPPPGDFMADLFDDATELGGPPAPTTRTGPVEILTVPEW